MRRHVWGIAMITAAELLAASQPMRPRTPEEGKRALMALGIDEEPQKRCIRCFTWKETSEFYTGGMKGDKFLYHSWCKECCREREREKKAAKE